MNLSITTDHFSIDVGKGDLYLRDDYTYPWFFESSGKKMMKDPKVENVISIRTWKGEIFQFSLDSFHSNKCLLITSTLLDCAFIPSMALSIDKAKERAKEASEKKHEVKNSYSGYFTFGKKLLAQYDTLEKHLKEQEIYFSDGTLKDIYTELVRRAKHE